MGEVRFMISEAAKQVHVESHVLRYWEEELDLKIGRTEMGHRYYTEDDIQLFRCIKKLKNEGMLLRDLKPLIPELKATRRKLAAAKPAAAEKTESTTKPGSATKPVSAAKPENAMKASAKPDAAARSDAAAKQKASVISDADQLAAEDGRRPDYPDFSDIPDTSERSDTVSENKFTSDAAVAKSGRNNNASLNTEQSAELSISQAEVIPVTQLEQARNLIGDVLNEVVTSNNEMLEKNISRKVTADVIREMDFLFQAKERREEEHFRKLDCLIRQQQANRREASKESPLGKLKKILT